MNAIERLRDKRRFIDHALIRDEIGDDAADIHLAEFDADLAAVDALHQAAKAHVEFNDRCEVVSFEDIAAWQAEGNEIWNALAVAVHRVEEKR